MLHGPVLRISSDVGDKAATGKGEGEARYTLRQARRSTLLCWKLSVSSEATVKSWATGLQPSLEPQKSIFRSQ